MYAAHNGYINVVKTLVAARCNPHARNVLGATAADIAAASAQLEAETYLAALAGSRPGTAKAAVDVFEAAKRGDYDALRMALDKDPAAANRTDEHGASPLMFAAMRGHLAAAELLVDRGANLDVQDGVSQWTALMNAASV